MRCDDYAPEEELNTTMCARIAGVHRRTIVAWIRRGLLPATQLPGARGHYRVVVKDLDRVLRRPAAVADR